MIATVFNDDGRDGIKRLAQVTEIPYGSLRNAIAGRDEMALYRIVRIERALGLTEGSLVAGDNDGVPDEPPTQPEPAPKPPPRREEKAGTGPPRTTRVAS